MIVSAWRLIDCAGLPIVQRRSSSKTKSPSGPHSSVSCWPSRSAFDIGRHIIAAEGLNAADTYADVFTSLAEAGVIPNSQVRSLRAMARFRNRLVHLYDETDDAEIVKALQHDLGDLDAFRQQIAEFVLRN
ncbi:MAG TPA: DUF86 domain-containing protein [Pseudonocardiaceae bacterium]|nr:DUF86 domain-containing protein [Pseudonocardiaceae bacterium]